MRGSFLKTVKVVEKDKKMWYSKSGVMKMTGFTKFEEMFAQSIGLTDPWKIEKAEFDEEKREVHVYVTARKTAKYPCPECGKMCERYDDE